MDRVENYRNHIQSLLEEHSKYSSSQDDVESELFFDTIHDRYQLMRVGWNGLKRVYYTVMHFDLRDGKIWIQQNMTDVDVGQEYNFPCLLNLPDMLQKLLIRNQELLRRNHTKSSFMDGTFADSWSAWRASRATVSAFGAPARPHSTVTLLARLRGLSTSVPRAQAVW